MDYPFTGYLSALKFDFIPVRKNLMPFGEEEG